MLQLKSIINVIDNSGAVWAECIRVLHGGKYARIGNRQVELPERSQQAGANSNNNTLDRNQDFSAKKRAELQTHREKIEELFGKEATLLPPALDFNQGYRSRRDGESQVALVRRSRATPKAYRTDVQHGIQRPKEKRGTQKKTHRQARVKFR